MQASEVVRRIDISKTAAPDIRRALEQRVWIRFTVKAGFFTLFPHVVITGPADRVEAAVQEVRRIQGLEDERSEYWNTW